MVDVFRELQGIMEQRLKESLHRLVLATYNNVGMPRAYCGCAGGFVIGLIGRCVRLCLFHPPLNLFTDFSFIATRILSTH